MSPAAEPGGGVGAVGAAPELDTAGATPSPGPGSDREEDPDAAGPPEPPSGGVTPPVVAPPPRTTRRTAHARNAASRDDQKVRRAALSIGVAVALTTGAVVLVGCVVLVILSMANAVPLTTGRGTVAHDQYGRIVIIPEKPHWGWLNADQFIWAVAILALVVLVLSPLVAWFVARRAVKPMVEALQLQRHFVADASHELRTPLTALSARVQILRRRLASGRPVDDIATQLLGDTANITRVLDDMLLTAEGTPVVGGAKTSVVASVRQAVTSLSALAEQSGVTLMVQTAGDMTVAVPEISLTRAIVAIVDNAIQHSPQGASVEVSAGPRRRMAVIRVTDHGGGIAGVDPSRLFERFAHGPETGGRKRSFGGRPAFRRRDPGGRDLRARHHLRPQLPDGVTGPSPAHSPTSRLARTDRGTGRARAAPVISDTPAKTAPNVKWLS